MTQRPIYIVASGGSQFVRTEYVSFEWHSGFAATQAHKSIQSLHSAARKLLGLTHILEISTKSPIPLGISLSAFNLEIETAKHRRTFTVETAYQSSKVFENGGPFTELISKRSVEAKRDRRLVSSGKLVGFRFCGVDWPLDPPTAFYDWLYVNALRKQKDLLGPTLEYSAFTDIAFNPSKSINCQAHSAALCVALARRGLLSDRLAQKDAYLEIVGASPAIDTGLFESSNAMSQSAWQLREQSNASRNRGVRMPTFDSLKFPTWDAYKTVMNVLERWKPGPLRREEEFEESLLTFLARELPDVEIEKCRDNDMGIRADIVIGDSLILDVKSNIDSVTKYQEVLEKLSALNDWAGAVIVLLTGRTDTEVAKSIKSQMKRRPRGKRIAVVQK
jgi:hypothetical protein